MFLDRAAFYKDLRREFRLRKLGRGQVDGFEAILNVWDATPEYDEIGWLAYILATAWHETGRTMEPVREGFGRTDEEAYQRVTKYCASKNKKNYAARHANGQSYYGRGYVQLTHGYNYKSLGERLGFGSALYDNPEMVMNVDTAAKIIAVGMMEGLFGRRLTEFIGRGKYDWAGARRSVNGTDKKDLIAGHARKFCRILNYGADAPQTADAVIS